MAPTRLPRECKKSKKSIIKTIKLSNKRIAHDGIYNNLMKASCFEFRHFIRRTCPRCYENLDLSKIKTNVRIPLASDTSVYSMYVGNNVIRNIAEYAVFNSLNIKYKDWEKKSYEPDAPVAFQLHGAGLTPVFFTLECKGCIYSLHLFPEKRYPAYILRFREYQEQERPYVNTGVIAPKVDSFTYTHKKFSRCEKLNIKAHIELTDGVINEYYL